MDDSQDHNYLEFALSGTIDDITPDGLVSGDVLSGYRVTEVPIICPPGIASYPSDATGIYMPLGGDFGKLAVIISGQKSVVKFEKGKTSIVDPDTGEHGFVFTKDGVFLKNGDTLRLVAAQGDLDTDGDALI